MLKYVEYNGRKFNINNTTYLDEDGKEKDIDTLPYSEHYTIEVIYTANYIWEQWDEYGLNEEECVEVAERAREYMDDYGCEEDVAIYEALEFYNYSSEEYEEEEEGDES